VRYKYDERKLADESRRLSAPTPQNRSDAIRPALTALLTIMRSDRLGTHEALRVDWADVSSRRRSERRLTSSGCRTSGAP